MNKLVKYGLLALGGYLLYRWWKGDDVNDVVEDVTPWDENVTEDGGGGGGGSPGGGDYQAPETTDKAGTSTMWAPDARKVSPGKILAAAGVVIPAGRDAANVKPGFHGGKAGRAPTSTRQTPIPRRPPR